MIYCINTSQGVCKFHKKTSLPSIFIKLQILNQCIVNDRFEKPVINRLWNQINCYWSKYNKLLTKSLTKLKFQNEWLCINERSPMLYHGIDRKPKTFQSRRTGVFLSFKILHEVSVNPVFTLNYRLFKNKRQSRGYSTSIRLLWQR